METYHINIKIHAESDLYNPFDESKSTLNGDVVEYIANSLEKRKIQEKIILSIKSDTPVDSERVRKAFQNLIVEKKNQIKKQRKLNMLKQLRLLIIGVVFIALVIFLNNKLDPLLVELISIVGSFSVWEAANIWIVENPKIHWENRFLQYLNSTKIEFD